VVFVVFVVCVVFVVFVVFVVVGIARSTFFPISLTLLNPNLFTS